MRRTIHEKSMGQTFAVVPVPIRDTVLGGLTAETDGSRVDLVARLEHDGQGPCYAVDFVATGISGLQADETEEHLREVFTSLVRHAGGDGRWHAQGRVLLADLSSRALRVLGAEAATCAEPWIDIKAGIACIHLRPRGRDADEAFRAGLERTLRERGLDLPVRLENVDDRTHRRHVRCLDTVEPGPVQTV